MIPICRVNIKQLWLYSILVNHLLSYLNYLVFRERGSKIELALSLTKLLGLAGGCCWKRGVALRKLLYFVKFLFSTEVCMYRELIFTT